MECKVSIPCNNTKTQSHNTFKSVCVFARLFRSLVPNQSHKRRERWLRWDHYYTMGPLFLAFVTVAPLFSNDHPSVTIWLSFNPVQWWYFCSQLFVCDILSYIPMWIQNAWKTFGRAQFCKIDSNLLHKKICQIWVTVTWFSILGDS